MAGSKRARNGTNGSSKKRQMIVHPSKLVVPGYTRNNGVYGRFSRGNCCKPAELKYWDFTFPFAVLPTSGTKSIIMPSFNVIEQGTGPSERIGQKIRIRSIGVNFTLSMPAGTVPFNVVQSHLARFILLVDQQANGLSFTANEVLTDAFTASDPSATAFRNLHNSGRFKFLSDTKYALNYAGNGTDTVNPGFATVGQVLVGGSVWKECDITIDYSGSTGTLPEIRSNNIAGMLVLNDPPIAGTGGVTMFTQVRIRYEDQ